MAVRTRITRHEELRRRAGFTVTGLAREFERSHTYVSRVESGSFPASPWYMERASERLGASRAELFDAAGYAL